MLRLVIAGGQTGVDQAAWRAARSAGLRTGGAMPLGFLTEEGPRPEFARDFGAVALPTPSFDDRTRANAERADATLAFVDPLRSGPGTLLTLDVARSAGKPLLVLAPDDCDDPASPARIARWVVDRRVRALNVAGDRESTIPGIGRRVEPVLAAAFALCRLAGDEAGRG